MTHVIPFGTSEPQDFSLSDRGAVVGGAGIDVAIEISRYAEGVVTPVSGIAVEWLDTSAGTVRVSGVESLTVATYLVRFKLTDADDNVGYAPNSEKADVWKVVPVANR